MSQEQTYPHSPSSNKPTDVSICEAEPPQRTIHLQTNTKPPRNKSIAENQKGLWGELLVGRRLALRTGSWEQPCLLQGSSHRHRAQLTTCLGPADLEYVGERGEIPGTRERSADQGSLGLTPCRGKAPGKVQIWKSPSVCPVPPGWANPAASGKQPWWEPWAPDGS